MRLLVAGLLLIGVGVVYLRRPAVYRQGMWLSEANYRWYVKALGVVFIIVGVGLVAYSLLEAARA